MRYIFFDLDGTIIDPKEGITKSVCYALEKYGIKVKNMDSLLKFIGPPLVNSFQEFYGFSQEDALKATAYYREYYGAEGIYQCELYEGMREMLEHLYNQGKKLIVATSKPTEFAIKILEHFDIYKYFDFVAGSTMDNSRKEKADIIRYALDYYEESDVNFDMQQVVMIGDRKFDYFGAREFGIPCVLVAYGYGEMEELVEMKPFAIKKTVSELEKFLDMI